MDLHDNASSEMDIGSANNSIKGRNSDKKTIKTRSIELCMKLIRLDEEAAKGDELNGHDLLELVTLSGLDTALKEQNPVAFEHFIGSDPNHELVRTAEIANIAIGNATKSKAEEMIQYHRLAVCAAQRAFDHRKDTPIGRRDPLTEILQFKDKNERKLRSLSAIAEFAFRGNGISVLLSLSSLSGYKTHGPLLNRQVQFWEKMCVDRKNIIPSDTCAVTVSILTDLFTADWRKVIFLHPPLYDIFDKAMSDLLTGAKQIMKRFNLSSIHLPAAHRY